MTIFPVVPARKPGPRLASTTWGCALAPRATPPAVALAVAWKPPAVRSMSTVPWPLET